MNGGGTPEARRSTGRFLQVTATGLTRAVRAGRKAGKALREDMHEVMCLLTDCGACVARLEWMAGRSLELEFWEVD